ncbi:hypothetical protein Btru_069330 [Bulinus truncatus]|nr:hypothetical protein Btru_069330 [Bulinus truncatus]
MDVNTDEMKKSGSRFQVARVDSKDEDARENLDIESNEAQTKISGRKKSPDHKKSKLANIDTSPPETSNDGRVDFSNCPESPCATFSLSGDSMRSRGSLEYTKTNCVMNTIEALPCVDHYRNIFSATGGNLKVRPTLAELHEELDDDEIRCIRKDGGYEGSAQDILGQGEKVVTSNPVRFGWIQGVLIGDPRRLVYSDSRRGGWLTQGEVAGVSDSRRGGWCTVTQGEVAGVTNRTRSPCRPTEFITQYTTAVVSLGSHVRWLSVICVLVKVYFSAGECHTCQGDGQESVTSSFTSRLPSDCQRFSPKQFPSCYMKEIRCILNIFGVMLFIRLPWVVGNAGIIQASCIVLLSGLVTTLTAISMTAICTNGEVKGGGAYYMISRSLGPEFGGAIGIIFSVANTVAVAMYVVGFSETVREILERYDCVMTDKLNDVRIIGSITIIILLAIAIVGMNWEARAQVILLVILTLAILNFFVGLCIPPTPTQMSQGFLGIKEVFLTNLLDRYEKDETFFSVFAVFFPAATGILAGANISGDLKDASKSIPKGTFLAILITTLVYLLIAIFSGACILRNANGIILVSAAATNVTHILNNSTGQTIASVVNTTTVASVESFIRNASYLVVEMTSAWGPLILAGIFSATLSSALASLMSAPKVFQALCKDKIFPFLEYFGVGYGANDTPRRAFILCFFIGFAFNMIADLNAIAPLISNFFLMSYALINFSCFDASIANSPGWRPSFRFYSKWLSLGGAILCIVVMFIINWITAFVTFGCVGTLFLYVHHRKPDVNWGSSTQAHVYRSVLQSALKLVRIGTHVKNFRPQVLVMSGEPETRPALVDFCTHITKKMGLMVCGNVIIGKQGDHLRKIHSEAPYHYFSRRHIRSFYSVATASTFQLGAQALMQNVGIGKFRPNLLILGFKSNWQIDNPENVQQYLEVIHDAFDLRMGVGILRVKEGFGLDIETNLSLFHQEPQDDDDQSDDESPEGSPSQPQVSTSQIESEVSKGQSNGQTVEVDQTIKINHEPEDEFGRGDAPDPLINPLLLAKLNTQVLKTMNIFRTKEKGTIDVWWLFDDGGLTLLLPYILTTKPYWRGCRLRVFAAGTKRGDLGYEQRQLATLLAKFRIDCKDMTVLPEINKKPNEESVRMFNSYLAPWKLDTQKGETKKKFPWKTTDDELELLREKTQRQIRLRELLLERSKDAALIVMTLPMPRKSTCPAGLYMCWIDTLTRDMPPILLVRGNQESVLTFYS